MRILTYPRSIFGLIALMSAGILAYAVLYLQSLLGLDPCPMCIMQRFALIGVIALCALAALCRGWRWRGLWAALAFIVTGFGAFTAARQSWLQWYPPEYATCGRDLGSTLTHFPLLQAIPMLFRGNGDCSKVDWTFLGGSIANWSFVWFAIILALIIALFLARKMR